MSTKEFRQTVTAKGWTYADLAYRWNVSPSWISRIAANTFRDFRYDDSVRGLPAITRLELRQLQSARKARELARNPKPRSRIGSSEKASATYRYASDFVPRSIVFSDELGEGVVIAAKLEGGRESYLIKFSSDQYWFSATDIDRGIYATGRMDGGDVT